MSATLPPAASEFHDRPSDFGAAEFWRDHSSGARVESIPPESRVPIAVLSPEQQARRHALQRVVSFVVGGLVLFTGAAALAHFGLRSSSAEARDASAAPSVAATLATPPPAADRTASADSTAQTPAADTRPVTGGVGSSTKAPKPGHVRGKKSTARPKRKAPALATPKTQSSRR